MKARYRTLVCLLILTTLSVAQTSFQKSATSDQDWDARFFQPYVGAVYGFVKIGNWVYMGGANITRWDGHVIELVGGGVSGDVNALATDGTNLYIGGVFTSAGGNGAIQYVAKWNGSAWSALGTGVNGTVNGLAWWNSALYVGGSFTSAGGLGAASKIIARWNGAAWDSLGGNRFTASSGSPDIAAVTVVGNSLYVAGKFNSIAGRLCNNIAQFNGSSYDSLRAGIVGVRVRAVTGTADTLYAIGDFTTAGGIAVNSVARWAGGGWDSLKGGLSYWSNGQSKFNRGFGYCAAMLGGQLYVGGLFGRAGTVGAADIARWDGSNWHTVADAAFDNLTAPQEFVYGLFSDNSELYVGGNFNSLGPNLRMPMVARWNGTRFHTLGDGFSPASSPLGGPQAMLMDGNSVLVSGYLGGVGGAGGNLVRWNDIEWSGLNAITNGTISAIAKNGTDIYIGGNFNRINGDTANYVAHWNGTKWVAMGNGFGNSVTSLVYHNGTVYAGGNFTGDYDGVNTYNYVAMWNGSQWVALGTGMNSYVQTLAFVGDTLYAGGGFTTAGGVPTSFLAKWNGSAWSQVGVTSNGLPSSVYCLLGVGSDLYVGGYFDKAAGATVNSVAKWNGSTWSGFGSGLKYLTFGQGSVYALALRGSQLIAGGDFQSIQGSDTLFNVAYWNGSQWNKMGSGIRDAAVSAVAASSQRVYFGGAFTAAGGKASNLFAVCNIDANGLSTEVREGSNAPEEFTLSQNYPNPFNPSTTIKFTVQHGGRATLKVYNVLGQEVVTLFEGDGAAGVVYQRTFDAKNLPSGLYVARLESGTQHTARKLMLLK